LASYSNNDADPSDHAPSYKPPLVEKLIMAKEHLRVSLYLEKAIPNFAVFSLYFPIVEYSLSFFHPSKLLSLFVGSLGIHLTALSSLPMLLKE
jgi:hypothetical protein